MDEIEEKNDDIDIHKFAFLGRNKANFNFNVFDVLLNFLLNIFNAKTSLKRQNLSKEKQKKIEELEFNYKPKNK